MLTTAISKVLLSMG